MNDRRSTPGVPTHGTALSLARASVRVTAAIGYEAMTVADIAKEAGCGYRTSTRHYAGKSEAFAAGYLEIVCELCQVLQEAYDGRHSATGRTYASLGALAAFLADDQPRASVLLVHGHAAGRAVVAIYRESMERLTDLILRNTADLPQPVGDPRALAQAVAGGIQAVAFSRILRGQARRLPGLVPEWATVVMAPYVELSTIKHSNGH